MKPEDITPIESLSGLPALQSKASREWGATAPAIPLKTEKSDGVRTPSIERIELSKLQNSKSQYHQLAHQIRELHQAMEKIDANLEKMKTNLESIIKIYPPYPPGSAERVESLRQFSALRKMIDQLAPIQGDRAMEDFLAQPAVKSLTDKAGNGVGAFEGHWDLDIPALSTESSDQEIHSALKQTLTARQSMAARRNEFAAAANQIISQII